MLAKLHLKIGEESRPSYVIHGTSVGTLFTHNENCVFLLLPFWQRFPYFNQILHTCRGLPWEDLKHCNIWTGLRLNQIMSLGMVTKRKKIVRMLGRTRLPSTIAICGGNPKLRVPSAIVTF
jgi:hypothetical protein